MTPSFMFAGLHNTPPIGCRPWMLAQVSSQGRQLYLFLAGMDHSGAALPMRKWII